MLDCFDDKNHAQHEDGQLLPSVPVAGDLLAQGAVEGGGGGPVPRGAVLRPQARVLVGLRTTFTAFEFIYDRLFGFEPIVRNQ